MHDEPELQQRLVQARGGGKCGGAVFTSDSVPHLVPDREPAAHFAPDLDSHSPSESSPYANAHPSAHYASAESITDANAHASTHYASADVTTVDAANSQRSVWGPAQL